MTLAKIKEKLFHWINTSIVGKVAILLVIMICALLLINSQSAMQPSVKYTTKSSAQPTTVNPLEYCLAQAQKCCGDVAVRCDGMAKACYTMNDLNKQAMINQADAWCAGK